MDAPSTSAQPQTWAAIATAIAGAVAVLAKKRFGRSKPATPTAKLITHAELQQGLDGMRERVNAGYTAMTDKFAEHQREILSAIGTQGTAIEKRLDALESTVARLDERTKK
ncbi:MAG TPA: hypothetical protein VLT36_23395 [Candidatus Dormibacteraeota bacterium]|nr:hypothetical protein [Candidatus Dormibacteraeota bacterium]